MPERFKSAKRRLVGQRVKRVVTPVIPPSNNFGGLLPARIPQSTGTHYYVSPTGSNSNSGLSTSAPWLTPQFALQNVSLNGGVINLMAGTYALPSGDGLVWNRAGSSTNPVTIRNNPGETVHFTTNRFYIQGGSYLRIKGEVVANPTGPPTYRFLMNGGADPEGIRASAGAHHIDIDGIHIHNRGNMGILLGSGGNVPTAADATFIQIWNCRINTIGDLIANQNHGMYLDNVDNCVVANCLIYDNFAFGIQAYPAIRNTIITCNTVVDHPNAAPVVMEGTVNTNVRWAGNILAIADTGFDAFHTPGATTQSGNNVHDCHAMQTLNPSFNPQAGTTFTNCNTTPSDVLFVSHANRNYHLQAGSPALNKMSARPGYVTPTDIEGTTRLNADIGCYARV